MSYDMQRDIEEIRDRMVRVETRITRWLESQGFETNVRRPRWTDGKITVPTRKCSMEDCLSVIPSNWPKDKPIDVFVHDDYITTLYLTPED